MPLTNLFKPEKIYKINIHKSHKMNLFTNIKLLYFYRRTPIHFVYIKVQSKLFVHLFGYINDTNLLGGNKKRRDL